MKSSTRCTVAWLVCALVVAGCATAPDPNAPKTPVVIAPLNFESPPDDQFIEGLELLDAEVIRQLQEAGFACKRLPVVDAVDVWREAVTEVGGLRDPETAAVDPKRVEAARGAMARRMLEGRAPVAVVFPALVLRSGKMKNGGVRWDNVRRQLPIGRGHALDRKQLVFEGSILVSSMWSSAYGRDGAKLAEAYGGLEVQKRLQPERLESLRRTLYYNWLDRQDLFEDPKKIRQAVAISLEPIIEEVRAP